jgi:hypothetical protein
MAPPVKKNSEDTAALLAALAKDDKVVRKAVNATAPSGFATNSDLIEAFGLRVGSKYTAKCRLSRVSMGLDKNKNLYFSFNYQVVGDTGKGLTLSRYIGIDKDPVKKAKAYENIAFEFQKNGYETEGLGAKELGELAIQATKDKGGVMVQISGTKDMKNPTSKEPMVWVNAQRPYDIDADSEDSDDESPEEDTEEQEEEEESSEEAEESEDESSDEEEEEEASEEQAEYDEEDPSTWVGYSAKVKPDKVPSPIVCVVQSFDKKSSRLTVLNEKTKKTYTIYPDGIISWVEG